jgi:hypothetical protein
MTTRQQVFFSCLQKAGCTPEFVEKENSIEFNYEDDAYSLYCEKDDDLIVIFSSRECSVVGNTQEFQHAVFIAASETNVVSSFAKVTVAPHEKTNTIIITVETLLNEDKYIAVNLKKWLDTIHNTFIQFYSILDDVQRLTKNGKPFGEEEDYALFTGEDLK